MKISIIIPIYNVEAYLRQCLDSVLVDNSFTGQIICVNDGSTDGSLSILEEYAKNYPNIEIISQPNAGLSVARNTGLDRADGDYVLFLDSDDWLFPNVLSVLLEKLDGEEVLYYNARKYYEVTKTLDNDLDVAEFYHISGQSYFCAIHDRLRNVPYVSVVGGVYLRSFLIDNHLYNEPGIYHEDEYFTPQVLLTANAVSSINLYVYAYRNRSGSIMTTISLKHIKDKLFIFRSLYDIYKDSVNISQCFYIHLADSYVDLLLEAYENKVSMRKYWTLKDAKRFYISANNKYKKRIAKLSFVSPYLAYMYHTNQLPIIFRKVINRFL